MVELLFTAICTLIDSIVRLGVGIDTFLRPRKIVEVVTDSIAPAGVVTNTAVLIGA